MSFLIFILLLIPSVIKGDCVASIAISGEQNLCSGQNFTLMCHFNCNGSLNHVQMFKDGQYISSEESSNRTMIISLHVHSANDSHSGEYRCQTISKTSLSPAHITVKDCGVSTEYLFTANTTSSSLISTTYQTSTSSGILKQALIWYILFKTGVFLIGLITAALTDVYRRS